MKVQSLTDENQSVAHTDLPDQALITVKPQTALQPPFPSIWPRIKPTSLHRYSTVFFSTLHLQHL